MRFLFRPAVFPLGCLLCATPLHAQTTSDTTTVVTVTGKKPDVVRKLDSTVYNTANSPAGQAGTASDVLNTVPSVTVSPDGDVSLRGNSNVQVYVNGKPSAMMQGDNRAATLQSMAGSDIASVEVITNPSAKYDSNGQPIINIVLAKDRKPGGNATLIANLGNDGRRNANLSGNYNSGKLNISGRLSIRDDMRLTRRREDRTWHNPADGTSQRNVSASAYPARRASVSGHAEVEYTLSDTDTLDLDLNAAHRSSDNHTLEFHQDFNAAGRLMRDYVRPKAGPNVQDDAQADVTFTRQNDDGSQLKLSGRHSLTINFNDRTVRNVFTLPVQADRIEHFLGKTATGDDHLSGDYSHPFGETTEFALGFDWRTEINRFDTLKGDVDPVTGAETVVATLTNRFFVTRRIAEGYVTWEWRTGKWQVQPGARLENVMTRAHQVTSATESRSSFANLTPTLHVAYVLNDDDRWTFSYTRSLERPDARDLNPFLAYADPQSVTSGNPDLKPQTVSALEGGFEHSHGDTTWSATAYVRQSRRTITDYTTVLPGDVLLTTKHNGGNGRSDGIEAETSGKWGEKWKYSLSGNVFHAELQADDLSGVLRHSAVSYTAQFALDYSPREGDSLHLDGNVNGASITAQGTRSGTSTLNLSWRHTLTPRLSLVASANDIANGGQVRTIIHTSTVDNVAYSLNGGRVFFVGLRYRTGGGKD